VLSGPLKRVSLRPIRVLLAALLLAPLLAFTSPPRPASSGVAVAGGAVTSATGTAMPGVTVDLYAWPSDAVQQALKPGQPVPTKLLATATTDSAGKYMLTVPAAKLKAAAVESGSANLEVFSAVGGIWFFSVQASSLASRPSTPATVNLGGKKAPVNCGINPNGRPYGFTNFKKQRQRQPAWAVVGQGYINPVRKTKGDAMSFNYAKVGTHSQTSGLGAGISGYGFDAGYNFSGTNTSTATQEQDFPSQPRNSWFRTMFNVGRFRGLCYGPPNDSNIPYQHQHGQCPHHFTNQIGQVFYVHKCIWMVKSTGWFGAGDLQHPSAIPSTPAKFCGFEPKGQTIKTANEKAVQWAHGYDIGASTGIKGANLKADFSSSSQTGYDANAQMTFTFAHDGYLCGTNKDPSNAAILVMRSNKS
jgi:hypothetical protein